MKLKLSNKGPTTAYHCRHETWIEFVPYNVARGFTFADTFTFSEAASHQVSPDLISLYPNHDPIIINVPAGRDLSPADRLGIKQAELLVCVRLRITFRDAFTPSRFSDFGYWVGYDGLRFLSKYQDSN